MAGSLLSSNSYILKSVTTIWGGVNIGSHRDISAVITSKGKANFAWPQFYTLGPSEVKHIYIWGAALTLSVYAGLELRILLPQSPECWGHGCWAFQHICNSNLS